MNQQLIISTINCVERDSSGAAGRALRRGLGAAPHRHGTGARVRLDGAGAGLSRSGHARLQGEFHGKFTFQMMR